MFAEVIVDLKYQESQAFYDYIIPEKYRSFLVRGMRVIVSFQHQMKLGVVMRIKDSSDLATKEIDEVLDAYPSVGEELFLYADYLKSRTLYAYATIFYQLMPKELLMNFKKVIYQLKPIDDEHIKNKFNRDGIWRLKNSDQLFYPKLKKLKEQGIIDIDIEIKNYANPKYETVYTYQTNHHYRRALQEIEIIRLFDEEEKVSRKDLIDHGMSPSRIQTWLKHEVLVQEQRRIRRDTTQLFEGDQKKIVLNEEQEKIVKEITHAFSKPEPFLLKSDTSSLKIEVYLKAIEACLKMDKKVLVLVPEIMQISHMEERLKSVFKDVSIYHSGLSKGQGHDEFERIISNQSNIILGTRSAITLPIDDLGLILVDEEHDMSYIEHEGIQINFKELLMLKSQFYRCPVVFSSATPSIDLMYQAKQKKFTLLEMSTPRHQEIPKYHFVDMKEELKQKNTSILSNLLKEKISDRLNRKEQVILFYNKKGYAPYVLCRDCGYVPKCPHCDVSLTLYQSKNVLKCPYCGYEEPFIKTCHNCNSHQIKEVGIGIEYVESVIKRAFPNAKVLRLDKEITKTKNQHEVIYQEFKDKQADILIGTQMVSKGLDFEHVTLVGIILADQSFRVPAYDSHEQAYMLFTQLSRRLSQKLSGDVIIQGYDLKHKTLHWLKLGYDTFYEEALKQRKMLNYPPFARISTIIFEGKSLLKTYQEAFRVKKMFLTLNLNVLGPTESLKKKINDQYRFSLTIKHQEKDIKKMIESLENIKQDDIKISYDPMIER